MSRPVRDAKRIVRRGYRAVRSTSGTALHLGRRSVSTLRQEGMRGFYKKVQTRLNRPSEKEVAKATAAWKDGYSIEAFAYAQWLDCTPEQVAANFQVMEDNQGPIAIRSLVWFLPHFEHAYYGGVFTILRFAAQFAWKHKVHNTFAIISHHNGPSAQEYLDQIAKAYPELAGSRVVPIRSNDDFLALPSADGVVATSWITAYYALKFNNTKRKFYFVQDFEPVFHPAGSTSAQAEATYRFGFYGITNTVTLRNHYREDYGGKATFFNPSVDTSLFYPPAERDWERRPYQVFFYGRPNHWRNGFELGAIAMHKLKEQLGDYVQILAAGQAWDPAQYNLNGVVENLGLMSYEQTADLYRTCDAGLAMMFTRHPSYLPFEFMASGCLVVSNINSSNLWLLRNEENCLLTLPSASCIADTLVRGLTDHQLRRRITSNATQLITSGFANWSRATEPVYQYMCDPEAHAETGDAVGAELR